MSLNAQFRVTRGDFLLDVDFSIPAAGVTALYGPSGSGKTTLLRAIAGLDRHKNGMLKLGDQTWQDKNLFVAKHQRRLGYVFQQAYLFAHLSVQQNIEFALKRVPPSARTLSLDDVVDLLGLAPLMPRRPDHLSGGEQQRVSIARALATSPELLLMDEPLAALDADHRKALLPFFERLNQSLNIPIVYVSHYLNEVARLADYLVLLENGRIEAQGHIAHMLTRLDAPLARDAKAAALIYATIAEHDEQYQLTYLDSPVGRLTVERKGLSIGTKVRVRLAARDVSLTLKPQSDTSVLNIFPATIDEIVPHGSSQMMVRLLANQIPVLTLVTRKSVESLQLCVGSYVHVQAKSVALLS